MPQFENKEIIGRLLKSTIGVISRRTSESYANAVVGSAVKDLTNKYDFMKYIKIYGEQYTEIFELIQVDDEINNVEPNQIGKAATSFMKRITSRMGKDAGYYFIREIKEDLPTDFELILKNLGLDFDYLQSEFLINMKESYQYSIDNYNLSRYIITVCFEVLDKQIGRDAAFKILSEFIHRLCTEYEVLRLIKINDVRSIQDVDIVTIDQKINQVNSQTVGAAIQKLIQEINFYFEERGAFLFTEKLKDVLSAEYSHKLDEIGVNIDIIGLSQELIVKNVLKALVDVLSEYSTQSYAVLMVNNAISNFYEKFVFVKGIKIDSLKYSNGMDGIELPDNINAVRGSELGRALQKIIENISKGLGEDAGKNFIDKFKKNLGKAYVLRIEELGVNLHMIELKQNLVW